MQIFVLQGIIIFLVVLPVVMLIQQPITALSPFIYAGVIVWLVGFAFESVADAQLDRFIRNVDNRGQLLRSGVFALSRHPNYFGEATMWWGIAIMALGLPYGWVGIVSPLVITYVVHRISGPMLEEKMDSHPDFALYKEKTSYFIPLFPLR